MGEGQEQWEPEEGRATTNSNFNNNTSCSSNSTTNSNHSSSRGRMTGNPFDQYAALCAMVVGLQEPVAEAAIGAACTIAALQQVISCCSEGCGKQGTQR